MIESYLLVKPSLLFRLSQPQCDGAQCPKVLQMSTKSVLPIHLHCARYKAVSTILGILGSRRLQWYAVRCVACIPGVGEPNVPHLRFSGLHCCREKLFLGRYAVSLGELLPIFVRNGDSVCLTCDRILFPFYLDDSYGNRKKILRADLVLTPSVQRWAGIAQSVMRLASCWTVRVSNPRGGDIFRTRPDRPWGPPSLLYNGYRVFLGGKEAGPWR